MLYAKVEFDESIAEVNLLTRDRLKGGINYTHAPTLLIQHVKDVQRSGYRGLKIPIGYICPEQTEIEIVLFSIAKKNTINEEIEILSEKI